MTKDVTIKKELQKDANGAVEKAKSMVVSDNQGNKKASDFLKILKNFQKEIKAELRPAIDKANELHKHLTGQEKRLLAPLQEAEKAIKGKISTFLDEQERIRMEEQRKAREKAEAEERKIREEKERQQREWEAKEKAKREEADRLEKEGKEEEARKAREAAEKAAEKAEERKQQAEEAFVPAPIVESNVEKQSGISQRDNWQAEVLNEEKVIQAVMDGKLPTYCVSINYSALNRHAKLIKQAKTEHGIRFWNDRVVSART